MMLEVAGASGLAMALCVGELIRRKILGTRLEHSLDEQRCVQTWRVLRYPSDFTDALDRAIASDCRSIQGYQQRALRYEALRSELSQINRLAPVEGVAGAGENSAVDARSTHGVVPGPGATNRPGVTPTAHVRILSGAEGEGKTTQGEVRRIPA